MSNIVGAYVSERGLSIIEARRKSSGLEVIRTEEVPGAIGAPTVAVERLVGALQSMGIRRADVVVVVRGFGVAHHILSLPRAADALVTPIAERELRHLEPGLGDAVVGWLPLPDEATSDEGPSQRQVLAAGAPRDLVEAFQEKLPRSGYRLAHFTVLPAAVQRLGGEFLASDGAAAMVSPLMDGAFLGFFLSGALRLVVEPPMGDEREHDVAALAEETELGAMFVRQQFRGAQLSSVVLAVGDGSLPADAEGTFETRLSVSTRRLEGALSAGAFAAMGGVIDASSSAPLALAGARRREAPSPRSTFERLSWAAVITAIAAGVFAVFFAYQSRQTAKALADARRKIEQQTGGVNAIQQTTDQRQLISDARAAMVFANKERADLQRTLINTAAAVSPSIRMETLSVGLATDGWTVTIRGTIVAETNGRAVQSLNDFYQSLPQRMTIRDLSLDQLGYGAELGMGAVTFQVSFVVPTLKKPT